MPERGAEGGHHVTEHNHEATSDEKDAEVAAVVERPGEEASGEEHEGLDGADPGDVGGGCGEEVAGFVVGLEDWEGLVRRGVDG